MLALLSIIPGLGTVIQAIVTAVFNAKVSITQAKIGGDRDVAVQIIQAATAQEHEDTARLGIMASNKLLTLMLIAAAVPLISYEWKVYIWDSMLGWGTTEPVKGQVAEWGNTVWYFLFGSPTALGVAKLWFNRKTS